MIAFLLTTTLSIADPGECSLQPYIVDGTTLNSIIQVHYPNHSWPWPGSTPALDLGTCPDDNSEICGADACAPVFRDFVVITLDENEEYDFVLVPDLIVDYCECVVD